MAPDDEAPAVQAPSAEPPFNAQLDAPAVAHALLDQPIDEAMPDRPLSEDTPLDEPARAHALLDQPIDEAMPEQPLSEDTPLDEPAMVELNAADEVSPEPVADDTAFDEGDENLP
jgi:hypothetical protein